MVPVNSRRVPMALVVAAAENGVIGRGNALPWKLPADLQHFKALTLGHCLLMGRKTYDSIGRPLPGRTTLVLSRNPALQIDGCTVVTSIGAAQALVPAGQELMVAGGADIFHLSLPQARRIHLTRVHARIEGDTYFPELDPARWTVLSSERHPADERNQYPFSFITLEARGQVLQ